MLWKSILLSLALAVSAHAADRLTATQLAEMARSHPDQLAAAIKARFEEKNLSEGKAWASQGEQVFFAVQASTEPKLLIDDAAGPKMIAIPSSSLWYADPEIRPAGKLHSFYYLLDGARFGGSTDLPILGPLAQLQPGVPSGTLSEKHTLVSKIYDGMKSNYWIYVPAQYDAKTPAALMVFQDGEGYTHRDGDSPILNMIDNLIAQKKIPVVICVFVNPGDIKDSPDTATYKFVKTYSEKWHRTLDDSMRSTLYDTVSDRYPRYLRDEVLAEVEARYNIRKDAYSRAITGLSSGGICSFNAAWQMPEQFSRVLTWIGSYTSIQWKENPANPDGGQDYPEKVLREAHRNLRVWLQDGSNDMEWNQYGSWPLANIRMANALKLREYDFHFSFGRGSHNSGQGVAEFPAEMTWLWCGYNPALTSETYVIEPEEKAKPQFRVSITNRDSE